MSAPRKSGLAEDVVTNTWHFDVGGSAAPQDYSDINAALATFYGAIQTYTANSWASTPTEITTKFYNLGEPGQITESTLAGSPVDVRSFTRTGTGTTSLPAECAVVLGIRGLLTNVREEDGTIRPAARRRGRIFIGPLAQSAGSLDSTTGEFLVGSSFRTALLNAATALQATLKGTGTGINVGVLSKRDSAFYPAYTFVVDNAFDTIRSRGGKRTVVQTAAVVPDLDLGA